MPSIHIRKQHPKTLNRSQNHDINLMDTSIFPPPSTHTLPPQTRIPLHRQHSAHCTPLSWFPLKKPRPVFRFIHFSVRQRTSRTGCVRWLVGWSVGW